jgi:hypothetical protein
MVVQFAADAQGRWPADGVPKVPPGSATARPAPHPRFLSRASAVCIAEAFEALVIRARKEHRDAE